MGVLHGDAGIDLDLQFNHGLYKYVHMFDMMNNYKYVIIYFDIHIVSFYIFFLHRVYKMTLRLITVTFYIVRFCLGGLIIAVDLYLSW